MKVLARNIILLPIFIVSEDDVVVPVKAIIYKRGRCIVEYSHVGIFLLRR